MGHKCVLTWDYMKKNRSLTWNLCGYLVDMGTSTWFNMGTTTCLINMGLYGNKHVKTLFLRLPLSTNSTYTYNPTLTNKKSWNS